MTVKRFIISILKKMLNALLLLIVIIVLAIIMKVFLFATFLIPTPSMAPAIEPGDHVYVNKLLMGPRLFEDWGFLKGEKTKLKRIQGFSKVKRNDVLVFDYPYQTHNKIKQGGNVIYLKRCVAIPGDTFYIENGIYKVKGLNEGLGHTERQNKLSEREETSFIKEVRYTFPHDTTRFHWTIKDFGPLYVPAKGDNIPIDSMSILLYKNIIEYETDKVISVKNGDVYLGDLIIQSYTFPQNYYFMAGDYIFDSADSRYWGLLPDDLVVGKATVIWKSEDMHTKKYRWNRFFKKIK
jgi:signal peptidase I, bacterial type